MIFERNALLGLAAAALWGGGDFTGGMGVKKSGGTVPAALRVVLLGHICSLVVVASSAIAAHDTFPHGAALIWGLSGGVVSGLSLMAFYIALSSGTMGISAALSGLLCAAVPAAVSAATEGLPGWRRVSGFALAGLAIWLIASPDPAASHIPSTKESRRAIWLSLGSGLGFGFYFVSLKLAGKAGVLWPMAASRMGSISISTLLLTILAISARMRGRGRITQPLTRSILTFILCGSALDSGGNLIFILATRSGRLDVAAVLASLYPASTILLAAWFLHERTTRRQMIGMLAALPAVALITL